MPAAARSLTGKADGIVVPTDHTIVAALAAVIKVGLDDLMPDSGRVPPIWEVR